MFTGIVRERGRVVVAERNGNGLRLRVEAPETAAAAEPGDSVAVAGCCLTVTSATDGALAFDAVPETVARTNLGRLTTGADVNLEPALRAGEPFGGHFVQGHVDGTARVERLEPEGEGARVTLELPPGLLRYCVEKGSIAVDGVSLTIAALRDDGIEIALVPFTLEHTTLGTSAPGNELNVEVDLLAKYAERLGAT
ncbi:MAG TPA: riboflavin synthase [Gaiellaceae bacterium]|nr:riboflavin synthase [Gaiellaceae bacterium]